MVYRAVPCGCAYKGCPDWHVTDLAQVQGVHFNKAQAEAVAETLNKMELAKEKCPPK